MIFEINGLFINTENLVTLRSLRKVTNESVEYGIAVNEHEYILFTVPNSEVEQQKQIQDTVKNIVATIVNSMITKPVQKIKFAEDKDA